VNLVHVLQDGRRSDHRSLRRAAASDVTVGPAGCPRYARQDPRPRVIDAKRSASRRASHLAEAGLAGFDVFGLERAAGLQERLSPSSRSCRRNHQGAARSRVRERVASFGSSRSATHRGLASSSRPTSRSGRGWRRKRSARGLTGRAGRPDCGMEERVAKHIV